MSDGRVIPVKFLTNGTIGATGATFPGTGTRQPVVVPIVKIPGSTEPSKKPEYSPSPLTSQNAPPGNYVASKIVSYQAAINAYNNSKATSEQLKILRAAGHYIPDLKKEKEQEKEQEYELKIKPEDKSKPQNEPTEKPKLTYHPERISALLGFGANNTKTSDRPLLEISANHDYAALAARRARYEQDLKLVRQNLANRGVAAPGKAEPEKPADPLKAPPVKIAKATPKAKPLVANPAKTKKQEANPDYQPQLTTDELFAQATDAEHKASGYHEPVCKAETETSDTSNNPSEYALYTPNKEATNSI